jgi:hypothetical protein
MVAAQCRPGSRGSGPGGSAIEVLGLGGQRVVLLVVPADTEEHAAHDILMAAAAPDDAATIDTLLATAR